MSDLIKRSLQILTGGIIETGKDYASNIDSLVNDAKVVWSSIKDTTQTSTDTFRQMKSSSILKTISNWFYQNESDYDDYDLNGNTDEFDPGYETDSDEESTKVNILDAESMKDIAKGQVGAMYKIAGKQNEANIASTAEIVSSFNRRSSEIIASVNNINSTLLNISNKLDSLATLNVNNKSSSHDKTLNLYDSEGKLSISGIFDAAKKQLTDNAIVSSASMFGALANQLTPEDVVSMIFKETVGRKEFKFLNNKSINQIGEKFNDTVDIITQEALSGLIDSKPFKMIFGNLNETIKNKDYSKIAEKNKYNTNATVFDNMTRHTIIDIIPEYLKKINQNLSGEKFEIDYRGKLTTKPKNVFNTSTRESFNSSGLSWDLKKSIHSEVKAANINISKTDVNEAGRVLSMVYVMYLYRTGKRALRTNQISSSDTSVILQAVKTLSNASGKPESYWEPICMSILQRLSMDVREATNFAANVTRQLSSMDKRATEFAKNPVSAKQATVLSYEIAEKEYIEHYKEDIKNETSDVEDNKPKKGFVDRIKDNYNKNGSLFGSDKQKEQKAEKRKEDQNNKSTVTPLSLLDYSKGIFGILNRGINVRVTNSKKNLKGYGNYSLNGSTSPISTPPPINSDNSKKVDVKVSEGDNSKNPLKSIINDIVPERFRISMQTFAQLGSPKQNNDNSSPTNETLNKINKIISPLVDKIKKPVETVIGKKTVDENGKTHRVDGIVQKAENKISEIKTDVQSKINDKLDDIIIKKEYEKTVKSVNAMIPTDEASRMDQFKAQNILFLMQTATEDGDTAPDIGPISQQISTIKDLKLKQQLQKTVIPMLQRTGTKTENKSSGFLSLLLAGIGKIFTPIGQVVKSISSVLLMIGSKILSPIKKGISTGVSNIKSGVKNISQGIFGTEGQSDGLIKNVVVNPLKNATSKALSSVSNKLSNKESGGGITAVVKNGTDKINNMIKGSNKSSENGEQGKDQSKGIVGMISKMNPNSDFGKGFVSAFKETEKESEKKRIAGLKIETVADAKTTEIQELITGNKESIFTKIASFIEEIKNKVLGGDEKANDKSVDAEIPTDNTDDILGDNSSTEESIAEIFDITTLDISGSSDVGDKSVDAEIPTDTISDVTGNARGGGSNSSTKNGKFGAMFDLGKIAGGISKLVLGVGQIITTVIAATKVLGVVKKLGTMIFEDALKPLSAIGDALFKTLEPIVSQISDIIKSVASCLSTLLETVIDTIAPILEAIQPIFDMILGVLEPILDVLDVTLNVCLAPLMGVIESIIVPTLQIIGDTVQILLGIVQVGIGSIITAIGAVVSGIGAIARLFGVTSLAEQGKNLMTQGTDMVKGGIDSVVTGTKNLVIDHLNIIPGVDVDRVEKDDNQITAEIPSADPPDEVHGSVMDGLVGSGNISSTDSHNITTNNIYNTYGSGPQSSYGSYMNMGQRGCGPIALADAYSRRTGSVVNPRDMATHMAGNGNYNPNAGTSVGGFINAGRSLGMNMSVGGVTQASLKQASPNNPITVIGSGSDFGTRRGNNHYVNVVGTDRYGGAYVSNPLTGRVDRKPISTVANNSLMGIYGSGDDMSDIFQFDESVTSAMKELTDWTGSILKMFDFNSTEEKAKETINEKKQQASVDQTKKLLGEDGYAAYEDKAFELFKNTNPKRDGETDEDYKKRFEKKKDEYMLEVTNEDAKKKVQNSSEAITNATNKTSEGLFGKYNSETGEFEGGGFVDTMAETVARIEANSNLISNSSSNGTGSGGKGYFTADNGAALWVPYSDNIEVTETDITKNNYNSPLFEFFAKTMGEKLGYIYGSSWFKQRNNPNKEGTGSSGDSHGGIDFTGDGIEGKPLYATTSGVVERTNSDTSQAEGNSIMWKDAGGMYHWYMHMMKPAEIQAGSINAGDLLGFTGNTGQSFGAHLHYTIRDTASGWSSDSHSINPLMYFKNYNPHGDSLLGDNDEERIWSYLTSHGANKKAAAGFMGVWEHESDNNPNRLEGDYAMGGVGSPAVLKAFSSQESMNEYVQNMVQKVYNGWGSLSKSTYSPDGVNFYPGVGLAQWTGTRTQGLSNKAKSLGTQWNDLATQLEFWNDEVSNSYANALQSANAAGSAAAAAEKVLNLYEGLSSSNQYAFLSKRQEFAKRFYDTFKDWTPELSSTTNTTATGTGSSNTGYGVINSAGDAIGYNNMQEIGTWNGKNTGTVVANGGLNLRPGPSMDGEPIILIPNGTNLDLETSGTNGWLKTTYDGQSGYVAKNYISLNQSEWNNAYQNNGSTSMNAGSSGSNSINSEWDAYIANGGNPSTYNKPTQIEINKQKYDSGDPRYYKSGNNYLIDSKVFTNDDPRWRSAWYSENTPRHYSEIPTAADNLAHMMSLATNPNLREGRLYNELRKQVMPETELIDVYKKDRLTGEEWVNAAVDYRKTGKNKREKAALTEDLKYLHNAYYPNSKLSLSQINTRVKGSGDIGEVYDDSITQTLYNMNTPIDNTPTIVPSIDDSKFNYINSDYCDSQQPTVVNNYYLSEDNRKREECINKILSNTYNVKAERIEELISEVIDLLRERKEKKEQNNQSNNQQQELFSDGEIPSQLIRLYSGT